MYCHNCFLYYSCCCNPAVTEWIKPTEVPLWQQTHIFNYIPNYINICLPTSTASRMWKAGRTNLHSFAQNLCKWWIIIIVNFELVKNDTLTHWENSISGLTVWAYIFKIATKLTSSNLLNSIFCRPTVVTAAQIIN